MAESIMSGLFGLTPESYQDTRQLLEQRQALAQAQLDPYQAVNYMAARAGQQLGRGIGGLLGAEDPQLQRITAQNQILSSLDFTNPQSIATGISRAQQAGIPELAYRLLGARDEATVRQKTALAAQRQLLAQQIAMGAYQSGRPEQVIPEQAVVDLTADTSYLEPQQVIPAVAPSYDISRVAPQLMALGPEGVAQLTTAKAAQKALLPETQVVKEGETIYERLPDGGYKPLVSGPEKKTAPAIEKVGLAEGSRETVFYDKKADLQYVMGKDATGKMVRVPYSGPIDQTTSKTNLSVSQKQEEEFSKRRGFTQANALDEASNIARGGRLAIDSIRAMREQDASGQLFTGPLANSYVVATNFLASVGLLSKEQTGKLTSSQIYDKSAKDLVMQDLGGKLGAQISDADRKFVEDRIPQLTTSQKARTELLNKLEEIQREKIEYYRKMNAHANEFKNLNTFDFSDKYSGKINNLSADDLINKYVPKK